MGKFPISDIRKSASLVFVSGKIPTNNEGVLKTGTVAEKTNLVLDNIESSLKQAGLNLSDIVFMQIYITNMEEYSEINSAYEKRFTEPFPARAVVEVKGLPAGASMEFVATAQRKDK